jgi:cryptochrome
VFEEWLIDHETACNAGNWQWLSCTAFYAQYYKCYSPIAFPQKWDKEGEFVRKYVPELKGLDKRYVYEPWKAPIADQKRAGVRIQGDGAVDQEGIYPKPMFDFAERRTICLDGMKHAYRVGLYGNDPKVIDGTWRTLFDGMAEGLTNGKGSEDCVSSEGDGMDEYAHDDRDKKDGDTLEDKSAGKVKGVETAHGDTRRKQPKRDRAQRNLDGHFKRLKR